MRGAHVDPLEGKRTLAVLLLAYAAASLVHFTHNAELIAEYPNLPAAWSRADVYLAWLAVSTVGAVGWLLLSRGYAAIGLVVLAGYAVLGLDSLGHYLLAPFSAHTFGMNATILLEVTAAALVLAEVSKRLVRRAAYRGR
jgi:hypothetical protein